MNASWGARVLLFALVTMVIVLFAFGLSPWTGRERAHPADGESSPERIISLAPSCTEILIEFGAGDRLVAVSDHCAGVPDALPRVGDLYQPDFERIVGLDPDLVYGIVSNTQSELFPRLEERGIATAPLRGDTIEDVRVMLTTIGRHVGMEAQAEAEVAAIDGRLEREPPPDAPRVIFVINRDGGLWVAGSGFVNEMIRAAGGINVYGDAPRAWVPVDLELIHARDPDIIVDNSDGDGHPERTRNYWERMPLRAAEAGRIASFPHVHAGVHIPEWIDRLAVIFAER